MLKAVFTSLLFLAVAQSAYARPPSCGQGNDSQCEPTTQHVDCSDRCSDGTFFYNGKANSTGGCDYQNAESNSSSCPGGSRSDTSPDHRRPYEGS